jgi:Tfp pilus assembly PilM family ATPase
MPGTILGLDIGAEAIKAVAVEAKGQADVRVRAAEMVRLSHEVDPDAALKTLAERMSLSSVRCVISLPVSEIMFRQVTLPFRDEGRIRKALPFEIEPMLPVPADEVVLDYLRLPDGKLLVAAAVRQKVRIWIERVEAAFGPVFAVDVSGVLLHAAWMHSGGANGGGILLDVGESATTAVFYDEGAIVQVRSFAFGGQMITEALARDLDCDPAAAETVKQSGRYPGDSVEAREVCRRFCDQLKNTVEYMCISETIRRNPERITLTGGGALFEPLQEQIGEAFSLKPEFLDIARSGQSEIDPTLQGSFLPQMFNTALAAAKRTRSSRGSLNFRMGELAAGPGRVDFKGQIRRFAILGAVIVLLFAAGVYLDYHAQASRAFQLKEQIRVIFARHVGQGAVMVDPVGQLKTRLAESQKSYGLYEGMPDVTVVELLGEISRRIPSAIDLTLTSFYYENKIILVKGEANTMEDVSTVTTELAKSPHFKEVALGSTSMGPEGSKVNFDLRMELR